MHQPPLEAAARTSSSLPTFGLGSSHPEASSFAPASLHTFASMPHSSAAAPGILATPSLLSSLSSANASPVACGELWSQRAEPVVIDHPLNIYREDWFHSLLALETKHCARPDYMESVQVDVNHTMRSILIDWLVEVGEEYKLSPQTLHLTVNYIDRFLTVTAVNRSQLQLVGITCMLLASKYEEIYPPTIEEFVYISDNTYTRSQVLAMETEVIGRLNFSLTATTAWEVSRRFIIAAELDHHTACLVDFLLELFLSEPLCLHHRPSVVAAAACFLALYATKQTPWPEKLARASGVTVDLLAPTVCDLHVVWTKAVGPHATLKAVREKYSLDKMMNVSSVPLPPLGN